MNHVYVVNNHNIVERFETNDDLSKIISIIGRPINLELLTHLFETKKTTSFRNDFARKYYDDVLQLKSTTKPGSTEDRYEVTAKGIKNLSVKWFQDLQWALAVIANECEENAILNIVRMTHDDYVDVGYVACEGVNYSPKSTFTIVNRIREDSRVELVVNGKWGIGKDELKEGDVIVFRNRSMFENTAICAHGHVDLLTVDFNSKEAYRDRRSEKFNDYLNGKVSYLNYIKDMADELESRPYA
nr:MAG TPA: hypothetical protein [Caudoviricetes sp.]